MLEPEVYRTGVLKEKIAVKWRVGSRLEHTSMSWKPMSILLPLTLVRGVSLHKLGLLPLLSGMIFMRT